MNIHELDLNLLLVFDAIYSERSTTLAARKLNMSQSAVSHALRRLRKFTGDSLFYKAGSGVAPTRVATALAVPISHALATVEMTLSSLRNFDPATSDRTFRIALPDVAQAALVPALVVAVRSEAPNVRLEFVPYPSGRPVEALLNQEVDIAGMPSFAPTDDIVTEQVWTDRMTLIVSRSHPLANTGAVSADQLNEMSFIRTSYLPVVHDYVDSVFRSHGVIRRKVCTIADTETLYRLVAVSDLACVTGHGIAMYHNADGSIVSLDTPFELPEVGLKVGWTRMAEDDPGHKWMREHILSILQSTTRLMGLETGA